MNDDTRTTEYLKKLGSLTLRESSRARMEENLRAYAAFHSGPAVTEAGESRSTERNTTRVSLLTRFFNSKLNTMIAAVLIVLTLGFSTSYAAENSLPGDVLYPIKTEVSENIREMIAISSVAEAKLQARLAEERLREAEALAREGRLNGEAKSEIETRLTAHSKKSLEESDEVEKNGNAEEAHQLRASLESKLRAHTDTLTKLNAQVEGNNGAEIIFEANLHANEAAEGNAKHPGTIEVRTNNEQKGSLIITPGKPTTTVEKENRQNDDTDDESDEERASSSVDVETDVEINIEPHVKLPLIRPNDNGANVRGSLKANEKSHINIDP